MTDCVFCAIVAGQLPSTPVAESELAYAFRDADPQAPTHVLVVPREHVESAASLGEESAHLVGELTLLAQRVAELEGIDGAERGYRLVLNVGRDGHMTVPHLHLHVLGGRSMRWPPG